MLSLNKWFGYKYCYVLCLRNILFIENINIQNT